MVSTRGRRHSVSSSRRPGSKKQTANSNRNTNSDSDNNNVTRDRLVSRAQRLRVRVTKTVNGKRVPKTNAELRRSLASKSNRPSRCARVMSACKAYVRHDRRGDALEEEYQRLENQLTSAIDEMRSDRVIANIVREIGPIIKEIERINAEAKKSKHECMVKGSEVKGLCEHVPFQGPGQRLSTAPPRKMSVARSSTERARMLNALKRRGLV